jgi:hypothetical protein
MKQVFYTGKRAPFTLNVAYCKDKVVFQDAKTGVWLDDKVADKLVKENGKVFHIVKERIEAAIAEPGIIDDADIIDEVGEDDIEDDGQVEENVSSETPKIDIEKPIEEMNALELKAYAKDISFKGYTKYNTEDLREALLEAYNAE